MAGKAYSCTQTGMQSDIAGMPAAGGSTTVSVGIVSGNDYAFDPADGQAGMATFLNEGAGFFQQMTDVLFEERPASACSTDALESPSRASRPVRTNDKNPQHAFAAPSHRPGYVAGTILQTDRGQKLVQDVRPGDRILTRDHGFRPVVWVGRTTLSPAAQIAEPALCPVIIDRGALGPALPDRPMQVSPDQRLLVEGPRTKLLFGAHEVLVPASHLVGYPGISRAAVAPLEYVRIMCAAHEVIWADSIWSESFQACAPSVLDMNAAQRIELEAIFVQTGLAPEGLSAARRTLQRHEADLLLA